MRKEILDKYLESFLKEKNGPAGLACLCAQNYKIVYENYLGFANLEKSLPVTEKTLFRLFSSTKLITCTAALILFERGKYALDDPISRYFPEYRNPKIYVKDEQGAHIEECGKEITVKDCFTMTCGLPYDISDTDVSRLMREREDRLMAVTGRDYDVETEVRAMGEVPLMFVPGTHYFYGYGHDILSALVQNLSGMSTYEFMKKEILDPIGMPDTAYRYRSDEDRARMCTLYAVDSENRKSPTAGARDYWHEPHARYDMGGAGLFSTPIDYLRFTQMLANGGRTEEGRQILSRNTIDLMRTNQLSGEALSDFKKTGSHEPYGYGLGVRTRMPGIGDANSPAGEFGWGGYLGTFNSIDPDHRFSFVYMHQLDPDLNGYYQPRLRAVVYGNIEETD